MDCQEHLKESPSVELEALSEGGTSENEANESDCMSSGSKTVTFEGESEEGASYVDKSDFSNTSGEKSSESNKNGHFYAL